MADGKLKPAARALVHRLGISAKAQHRVKLALNKVGLYDDDQLRVFREVERVVKRSEAWLQTTQDGDKSRKKVLFWSVVGGPLVNTIEALWAHTLNAHGAESHVFICDKVLPLCDHRSIISYRDHVVDAKTSARLCDNCYFTSQSLFKAFELPVHTFSELISKEDIERAKRHSAGLSADECFRYEYEGQQLGHIVYSSVLRFLLRETLGDDPRTLQVIRDFLAAAIVMTDVSRRALDNFKPDLVVLSHGIYVNWGIMAEVARERSIPVVVWSRGYRKGTLLLSHNTTYHQEMLEEPASLWEADPLSSDEEATLDEYLVSRRTGVADYVSYHPNPEEDKNKIRADLGLDPKKKVAILFTNVIWDARVVFHDTAFSGIVSWIKQSIEYFRGRPDFQLVIRVHPAEVKGTLETQEKLGEEIPKWFQQLPVNVKLIPAGSDISSYTLLEMADAVLVYTSKVGLEAAALGLPVLVAGEAFYSGKGITFDAKTADEYFRLLEDINCLDKNKAERTIRARLYTYHFFFRKLLPFSSIINPHGDQFALSIDELSDLESGNDRWLDFLAERCFDGDSFVRSNPLKLR